MKLSWVRYGDIEREEERISNQHACRQHPWGAAGRRRWKTLPRTLPRYVLPVALTRVFGVLYRKQFHVSCTRCHRCFNNFSLPPPLPAALSLLQYLEHPSVCKWQRSHHEMCLEKFLGMVFEFDFSEKHNHYAGQVLSCAQHPPTMLMRIAHHSPVVLPTGTAGVPVRRLDHRIVLLQA